MRQVRDKRLTEPCSTCRLHPCSGHRAAPSASQQLRRLLAAAPRERGPPPCPWLAGTAGEAACDTQLKEVALHETSACGNSQPIMALSVPPPKHTQRITLAVGRKSQLLVLKHFLWLDLKNHRRFFALLCPNCTVSTIFGTSSQGKIIII